VTKLNFDQTPVLLETFDQVIRSSEIRSSDPLSLFCHLFVMDLYDEIYFLLNSNNTTTQQQQRQ
jgi:hypothetical protein